MHDLLRHHPQVDDLQGPLPGQPQLLRRDGEKGGIPPAVILPAEHGVGGKALPKVFRLVPIPLARIAQQRGGAVAAEGAPFKAVLRDLLQRGKVLRAHLLHEHPLRALHPVKDVRLLRQNIERAREEPAPGRHFHLQAELPAAQQLFKAIRSALFRKSVGERALRHEHGVRKGALLRHDSIFLKNWPVYERSQAATSSGEPVHTMVPPPSPPSGPRSTI